MKLSISVFKVETTAAAGRSSGLDVERRSLRLS
jgi:hypothetical protein